jgi:hypothetical protein
MKKYAVIENNMVINVISADSEQEAKNISGLDVVETEGVPWLYWTLQDDKWIPPAPFEFWTWDGTNWNPPTPNENNNISWQWNEDLQDWEEIPNTI